MQRDIQCEEDEDLSPDTSLVVKGTDTKRLEGGQDDKDSSPTVVKREWQVNKDFIGSALRRVMLFDDVVNMLAEKG